jgi:hypothetical protein
VNGPRTAAIFTTLADRASKTTAREPRADSGPDTLADTAVDTAAAAASVSNSNADEAFHREPWSAVVLEAEISAALHAPPHDGERIASAFERKEQELAAIFARLSVTDARSLYRRLTIVAKDDPVARKFGQMVVERRLRLLTFLAGARRREVLRQLDVKR